MRILVADDHELVRKALIGALRELEPDAQITAVENAEQTVYGGRSLRVMRFAKGIRAGSADGKLELIMQNLGAEYDEFTPLNQFEPRVLLRAGFKFHCAQSH